MSAPGGAEVRRGPTSVTVVRIVDVPRQRLFDLVADPRAHPRIDGSGTVRGVVRGPDRLGPGARFGMSMRMGLPYRVTNRVVAFDEGRRIAWSHVSGNVWRWEFDDVPGGTEVRETFDWGGSRAPLVMRRFAARNAEAMDRSIDRLARLAGTGGPGDGG